MPSPDTAAIRAATPSDAAAVAAIYNHYVTDTVVTFEEEPVPAAEMARRIEAVLSKSLPWLVAVEGAEVLGYAYAAPWKDRAAYRHSVEITVYLAHQRTGRGLGSKLYGQLLPALQARSIHAVIGGIALPNPASIALHEKFGLRKVAHFEAVGFKRNRWIDVGYWQRTLDAAGPARRPARGWEA
ncbi:MAG TPA: arsinothricin resistance N-acetyltransferase ArsN1 family B [Gemmatimonadales bacterium]|nr:arsinothricin resistance N-acetyltransferase ArsN1 family B [Gemmatimonadales bacterium]